MPVEDSLRTVLSGSFQQAVCAGFYAVLVTVGHIQSDTPDAVTEHSGLPGIATEPVAIPWHLMKKDIGIFLRHSLTIIKMVSQVNCLIRLYFPYTIPHEAQHRMGIGHH